MARYTYGQLEQLWISAGGPRALAPLMAAIALAESGGNPEATNPTDNGGTQTSWGLWQVSDGTHNQPVQGILEPLVNAKAAVAKYKSQGLRAWGTYDSGAYEQYYQGSVPPSRLPPGGGGGTQDATLTGFDPNWLAGPAGIIQALSGWLAGQAGGKTTSVAGALTGIVGDLTAMLKGVEWLFVPSHWVRVSCGILGAALFLLGLRNLGKAGSGDMSLALGILQVTIACALLFVAFHNLPDDVKNVQDLASWLSAEIRHKGQTFTGSTV
jgi:hypothetical protein